MDDNIQFHNQMTLKRVAEKLEKNGFKSYVIESGVKAKEKVLELVGPGESVGFGGSLTVKQLGLIDAFSERKQKLFTGKPGLKPEQTLDIRKQALHSDVFIASPNALTQDGKLMFWDSIGNRAAGMIFGPKRVIAVAGVNKIVENELAGWQRMKTFANPVNAKRLSLQTPCTADGVCHDCDSVQRICNIRVILDKKPKHTEYHVILVPECLGY
ncbi:MAG: lactate utilization protein [Elusimicrobiota bacterium]